MNRRGLTDFLTYALTDKRRDNSHIPFDILLCLTVAAKFKCKTSLTDVPFAVAEAELLAELGWNIWDNERDVNEGLFSESVMRKLLAKYKSEEWVSFYNDYVQKYLMKELDIQPRPSYGGMCRQIYRLSGKNRRSEAFLALRKRRASDEYPPPRYREAGDASGGNEQIQTAPARPVYGFYPPHGNHPDAGKDRLSLRTNH